MEAKISGNLLTTAMAVMPHTDTERALELALSMDVPFWPQLPNYSFGFNVLDQDDRPILFDDMSVLSCSNSWPKESISWNSNDAGDAEFDHADH